MAIELMSATMVMKQRPRRVDVDLNLYVFFIIAFVFIGLLIFVRTYAIQKKNIIIGLFLRSLRSNRILV